jgi:hypothetical protein
MRRTIDCVAGLIIGFGVAAIAYAYGFPGMLFATTVAAGGYVAVLVRVRDGIVAGAIASVALRYRRAKRAVTG